MNKETIVDNRKYEKELYKQGYKLIAGCDEVGRGPGAGPLVTACVILPIDYVNIDIKDSKLIKKHSDRQRIAETIKEVAIDYHIEFIDPETVDELNPKQASRFGMSQCIKKVKTKPDYVLVDYEKIDTHNIPCNSFAKGDRLSQTIAAASIIAKVARDEYMIELAKQYPEYGFDTHVGYLTKKHLEAIKTYGPIKGVHRFSYKGVK